MSPINSPKQNGHAPEIHITDENTPLLAVENAGPTHQPNADPTIARNIGEQTKDNDDDDAPLPKFQILVLCYARLVEPIAFFSIFAFVNKMIETTGSVPEDEVGFYSGLIESLFSLVQMCTMVAWGRAADRFGRRPILISSTIGTGIGMFAFGFASNVWQMIAFRCFAGIFSGSVVSIRTMFSEISTPKTAARAFSFFAVAGNVGIFIGPLIGGAFSEPVENYPGLFKGNELFTRFPYGLSSIVSGSFAFSAAILCFFCLKETLGDKNAKQVEKPMTSWEIVKSPGVAAVMFMYGWSSLTGLGYTAVAPVFWYTRPSLGGYGLSPIQIASYLTLSGASQALWMLFVFPPWQTRYGTGSVLRILWLIYPWSMMFNPVGSILRRNGEEAGFWTLSILTQVFNSSMAMTFTGVQLAVNDIAPSHQTLGTLNALVLTMTAAIRAVAPGAFASFFAFGVSQRILSGYLIWVLVFALGLAYPVILRYIPERALASPARKKEMAAEESNDHQ